MFLGSTQLLTEISSSDIRGGGGVTKMVGKGANNLLNFVFRFYRNSWNLKFLESHGSVKVCQEIALPLPLRKA